MLTLLSQNLIKDSFAGYFPDLPGAIHAATTIDAVSNNKECPVVHVRGLLDTPEPILTPSKLEETTVPDGLQIALVSTDL